jgi:hypothetical protein
MFENVAFQTLAVAALRLLEGKNYATGRICKIFALGKRKTPLFCPNCTI